MAAKCNSWPAPFGGLSGACERRQLCLLAATCSSGRPATDSAAAGRQGGEQYRPAIKSVHLFHLETEPAGPSASLEFFCSPFSGAIVAEAGDDDYESGETGRRSSATTSCSSSLCLMEPAAAGWEGKRTALTVHLGGFKSAAKPSTWRRIDSFSPPPSELCRRPTFTGATSGGVRSVSRALALRLQIAAPRRFVPYCRRSISTCRPAALRFRASEFGSPPPPTALNLGSLRIEQVARLGAGRQRAGEPVATGTAR